MSISIFATQDLPMELVASAILVLEASRGHEEVNPAHIAGFKALHAEPEGSSFCLSPDMNGLATVVDITLTQPGCQPKMFSLKPGTALDEQLETASSVSVTPGPAGNIPQPEF